MIADRTDALGTQNIPAVFGETALTRVNPGVGFATYHSTKRFRLAAARQVSFITR